MFNCSHGLVYCGLATYPAYRYYTRVRNVFRNSVVEMLCYLLSTCSKYTRSSYMSLWQKYKMV